MVGKDMEYEYGRTMAKLNECSMLIARVGNWDWNESAVWVLSAVLANDTENFAPVVCVH
jgi:hypothetical protein